MADQQPQPPLFGLLPAGQPLLTQPTSQPGPTSYLYLLPQATPSNPKPFSHLSVFLLPGVALPPNTAAAIYAARNSGALLAAGADTAPDFRFLGGVGPGKESAVFRLSPNFFSSPASSSSAAEAAGVGEGTGAAAAAVVVIGIEVEDAASVAERIQRLQNEGAGGAGDKHPPQQQQVPSTQILAQRIIQNAFNFLSGFSGKVGADGIEVVPLKAFQEWWRKFEGRVRSDPSFLERDQD
ncbi:hypothetical protein F4778DRAFT_745172 [Xylariomycetidae sp. FL2044]|nr:hypothetical protein F4778DRAFT_745172 [Xylariomycetidae sp. FL2044]